MNALKNPVQTGILGALIESGVGGHGIRGAVAGLLTPLAIKAAETAAPYAAKFATAAAPYAAGIPAAAAGAGAAAAQLHGQAPETPEQKAARILLGQMQQPQFNEGAVP